MANVIPIDSPPSALQSPIILLRKVRDVMTATSGATQQKLDTLVQVIAESLSAEVCSLYVTRPGEVLELFASYGLKQTSIHVTRLRVGEGLVGEVAATALDLNLSEPQLHPKFVYRPETGEELYHSFVGVPLLHSHKVVGVLVIQGKTSRSFSDDLVEILHTVAMVIAELAIGTKIVDVFEIAGQEHPSLQSQQLAGVTLSAGIAKAPVVLHRPKIQITQLVSEAPEYEEKRLNDALFNLQQSVDALISSAGIEEGSAQQEILESYRMFSQDRGWIERISEAIRTGLTAEAAVRKVQEEMHARLSQISSAYIQERVHDLEDLSQRLLYHLAGMEPSAAHTELPPAFILVAETLGPAELLEYNAQQLKGIIVAHGSVTAHVAIIARMMDVPMIGRIPDILSIVQQGDLAIIQGDHGMVYIRPPEDVEQEVDYDIRARALQSAVYAADRDLPAITKDGVKISLNINVGLYVDAQHLAGADVDGIGLFRTELPYLASTDMPGVEEQERIYKDAFEKARGKPIIFRSFDIGGDKQVPYIQVEDEENPAMGWRATRIGLDRPVILRQQFRALIRAAAAQKLHLMFPFIAAVHEFEATKEIFLKELERSRAEGTTAPSEVRLGSMLEIPSLLFQLPELMERVDFVSIGSNDLLQFLFACDRGSSRMTARYDPLHPAVLRAVRLVAEAARPRGVTVGFCGELSTRPIDAMALIAMGLRSLSMPPSAVGPVKAMIRTLDTRALAGFLDYTMAEPVTSLRPSLERFARDHGVEIH